MCNLTVGAVIQVNFCCFVFLHFNTTAQKIYISLKQFADIAGTSRNAAVTKKNNRLPSMEPVLTDVTLNHEASHIIWQATQAVHRYGCHGDQTNLQPLMMTSNSISNRIIK